LLAVEDFRTVLEHRGIDFMDGSDVYPMAEIELARAREASVGDKPVSLAGSRRVAVLRVDDDMARAGLSEKGR
jgi:hypothetical protein